MFGPFSAPEIQILGNIGLRIHQFVARTEPNLSSILGSRVGVIAFVVPPSRPLSVACVHAMEMLAASVASVADALVANRRLEKR